MTPGLGPKTKAILAKMIAAEVMDWPTPDMNEFLADVGCSDADAATIVLELAEVAAVLGVDLREQAARVSAEIQEAEETDPAEADDPSRTCRLQN